MSDMIIEVCNNRAEAEARKDIIKGTDPGANWNSRIIDNIDFVAPYLTPVLGNDPVPLPEIFTPETGAPAAPAAILIIWT